VHGRCEIGLELAVGVDVRREQHAALVGAVGNVDGHLGLGEDGNVDAGPDGEPVVELRAEGEGDGGDVEAVAEQLEVKLVGEVLLAFVGEKAFLVEKGAHGKEGVEAEDQALPASGRTMPMAA
jgi:hypothetical protein